MKLYSHAKYIVVFINRKDGLDPPYTFCKEFKTLMSTNVRMGEPGRYVRDIGRLLAIDGTRHKHNHDQQDVEHDQGDCQGGGGEAACQGAVDDDLIGTSSTAAATQKQDLKLVFDPVMLGSLYLCLYGQDLH
jgi:hypothetical protein